MLRRWGIYVVSLLNTSGFKGHFEMLLGLGLRVILSGCMVPFKIYTLIKKKARETP